MFCKIRYAKTYLVWQPVLDHCSEQDLPVPKEPVIFNKFASCIIGFSNFTPHEYFLPNFSGPNEPILIPKIGCDVDLEVELCVVIGKDGKHIPKGIFQLKINSECILLYTLFANFNLDKAMEHVFGFTAANDVSGRDWQMKRNGGQWLLGKAGIPFTVTV